MEQRISLKKPWERKQQRRFALIHLLIAGPFIKGPAICFNGI